MDERNPPAAGASAWKFINQTVARRPAGRERPVQIGHAITDVMDAGASLGNESGDRTVGGSGFQQLDLRSTEVERDDPGPVGLFRGAGEHPKDITIEGQGGVDALDRHTDMGNNRVIRHGQVFIQRLMCRLRGAPR